MFNKLLAVRIPFAIVPTAALPHARIVGQGAASLSDRAAAALVLLQQRVPDKQQNIPGVADYRCQVLALLPQGLRQGFFSSQVTVGRLYVHIECKVHPLPRVSGVPSSESAGLEETRVTTQHCSRKCQLR